MSNPAKDLLELLRNVSTFKDPGDATYDETTDSILYYGRQPAEPARCITVKNSGGPEPLWTHSRDAYITQPTVQVLIRAKTTDAGEADAQAAWEALRGYNLVLGSSRYLSVQPSGSIGDLGTDGNDRRQWSFTVQLMRSN